MAGDIRVGGGRGIVIPAGALEWQFVRSSGPGGQHVNRTASKAVLRYDVRRAAHLPADVRLRLLAAVRSRLTGDGAIRQEPLRRLLLRQVAEMHAAEKDALQVLAELAAAARSPRLGLLLRLHVAETREHITRLRHIMDRHGVPAGTLGSRGKRGLLEDCIELACSEADDPTVRDTALAAVALHLEHDEIASYESVCTWAGLLGLQQAAGQLALTMAEERRAEGRLRRLSESLHAAVPTG